MVNSSTAVFSSRGQISSKIPPESRGFEIITPFGRFTDWGTEFFVSVDPEKTDLEVVSGTVVLSRTREHKDIPLTTGRAISVSSLLDTVEIQGRPSRYINETNFASRLGVFLASWRQQEASRALLLDNDPDLFVRFLFDSNDSLTANRAKQGQSIVKQAKTEQTDRSEGPVSGTTAIGFSRNDARVRFDFSPKLSSMTLTTRVRVDRLRPGGNVLFASERFQEEKGAFLWQLLGDGAMQCQITEDTRGCVQCYVSAPVVPWKRWGTWCELAMVFDADAKIISFYADGRCVSTVPWPEPIPLVTDQVALGNVEKQTNNTQRFLQGAMAEFCIYGKAVSPDKKNNKDNKDNKKE